MIFSRIGSSVSRSKNAINGSDKWSSVLRSKGAFNTSNNKNSLNQLDSKLGFVRGYLAGSVLTKAFSSKQSDSLVGINPKAGEIGIFSGFPISRVVMASQQVGRWKINYPSKSLTQTLLTRLLTTETRTQKLERIADTLIDLNRIERHDYVILLRHKMGLTRYGPAASAPGPMSPSAGGGATTDSAAAKEKTAFDVKLEKFEASAKLKVIKEIRSFTDLGLKEAKDLVEKTPAVVKKGVTKEEGEKIIEKLKELGATVVLE